MCVRPRSRDGGKGEADDADDDLRSWGSEDELGEVSAGAAFLPPPPAPPAHARPPVSPVLTPSRVRPPVSEPGTAHSLDATLEYLRDLRRSLKAGKAEPMFPAQRRT